jgi:hypothetical protein
MNDDIKSSSDDLTNKNPDPDINEMLQESRFETPEEAAQAGDSVGTQPTKRPGPHKRTWAWLNDRLSKKQIIALTVLLIVVLVGLLVGAWMWKSKKLPSVISKPAVKKEEQKTTETSKLTGLEVPVGTNERPVTAVMIENSPDARPQSGLKDAGVVFEAVAEGGVTRFVALFQDTQPDYVGPIRSARPYYIEWILGFDAPYAHVGGSPDALAAIKSLGVKDLDQFANGSSYQRVTNRYAPHNVYTSISALNSLEHSKGWDHSNYDGFVRKTKETPLSAPTHKSINASLSGFYYNPHWDYEQASNSYVRSEANKPHTDERSGQAIKSKVLVVMVLNKGTMSDGYHSTYQTVGSGKVYVFQDGGAQEGTWSKSDIKKQIVFKDAAGKPLALNPGNTWVTAVGSATDVTAGP